MPATPPPTDESADRSRTSRWQPGARGEARDRLWADRPPHSRDDGERVGQEYQPHQPHGGRRRAAPEPSTDDTGDGLVVDRPAAEPAEPAAVPVRRLLSLGIAGFALLLTIGMVVGAHTTHEAYAVVILGVQALFVVVWTIASRPPAPRVVAVVGIAVAIGTDLAAVLTRPASLAPLAYVTAAGFIIGVIGQLARPAGRIRVTESLGSTLVVTLGVVAFATLVVLGRNPYGTQALVACLAAAGVAITVARICDAIVALPRISPHVPRGGAGVVLGAMVGTAVAGAIGHYLAGIPNLQSAVAGLATAIVAVMVDLSIGYAEASRHVDGGAPALWLARHIQGPIGAFAFAAPAAYAASALLLLQG